MKREVENRIVKVFDENNELIDHFVVYGQNKESILDYVESNRVNEIFYVSHNFAIGIKFGIVLFYENKNEKDNDEFHRSIARFQIIEELADGGSHTIESYVKYMSNGRSESIDNLYQFTMN